MTLFLTASSPDSVEHYSFALLNLILHIQSCDNADMVYADSQLIFTRLLRCVYVCKSVAISGSPKLKPLVHL